MAISTLALFHDIFAPIWVEVSFTVFFILGFVVLRLEKLARRSKSSGLSKLKVNDKQNQLHKNVEADFAAGQTDTALKAFRSASTTVPASLDTLRIVTQAFLDTEPKKLVEEVSEHLTAHTESLGSARTCAAVLDVIARSGSITIMEEFVETMQNSLRIKLSCQVHEVLLGGYAAVGDEKKVAKVMEDMRKSRQQMTARGYSLTIKGYLKNVMLDAALQQIKEMRKHGFFVPSFAVSQLFRAAVQTGRATDIFDLATTQLSGLVLPSEAVSVIIDDCLKRNEIELALRVEKFARDCQTALTANAYDSLLKLCTVQAHPDAIRIFEDMTKEGIRISEGLCVGLLARCAESKFLRFAEAIVVHVRKRGNMTIAMYSALMKTYAYCNMYGRACDLYAQIREEGLEPDAMMYGCLMKFSVECGRTQLSQELFDKAPQVDIQNYMSLIRAAGRDRDVDRAFAILGKLKESGVTADIASHNCVLDACISGGAIERGRKLVEEMKAWTKLDIITYNTLLKGYCNTGDLKGALKLFAEMEQAGINPNDVSYNCLINAAVTKGNFKEAWNSIEMMQRKGVPIDNYTVSIMMKALKKVKDPRDVANAMSLLDKAKLDLCSDEVLLNAVLESCIKHRQLDRLASVVKSFHNSTLKPSIHTYGSMIKACSTLKHMDKCWELWQDMLDRALVPNDIVLGCMLDANVCNGLVNDAVKLFNEWKARIPPNTVMYSTLIKGFANSRQAGEALKLFNEMRELKLKMNTVVYNSLIDAQARIGNLDEVAKFIACMEQDGCVADAITYSTIVKAYCVKGEMDRAFEVFRDMQKHTMAGDNVVYNTILDGCTRHNRMDIADMVLEDLHKNNIKASNFTLGILVKMYARRHDLDKAFEVLEEMPRKHGIKPNAQVHTCLMCACINGNDLDRAFEVFRQLKASGQEIDSKTYSVLISGAVRHGQPGKAAQVVDEVCSTASQGRANSSPRQLLESEPLEQLLRAFSQRGQMETAGVPLLEKLRAAGVPCSGRLFNSALPADRSKP
jgi:pentatricopeptide repeat protein